MRVESQYTWYNSLKHEDKIYYLRRCDDQKDVSFHAARWSIYKEVISDWLSNKNVKSVSINEIDSRGVSRVLKKLKKFDNLIVDNIPTSFRQVQEKFLYRERELLNLKWVL